MGSKWITIAAINGLMAVAAGAFAAHALRDRLTPSDLDAFEVGARYQMYHALALLAVAWVVANRPSRIATGAGVCMLLGIVLFSGSLYVLALTPLNVGLITPLGGLSLILGWVLLAIAGSRTQGTPER